MKHEKIFNQRITCWDNGGETWDRFTVVYLDQPENSDDLGPYRPETFAARGMSSDPFNGFGQMTTACNGRHLGKKIPFAHLPQGCRLLVEMDLKGTK